ncbi:DEAD/DEAH box helicase [Bifidobacterium jacchi]|uniref:DEAD/DEAH box helicase n=1 Tax=Bifidobacterium jacchi TaxID=2490545 RepID=UPI001F4F5FC8|nr:DEAD/DEAH box helicase [Bifidobacterium jacchi]
MSISLDTPISSFMTNKRRLGALKSLGIVSVGDALTYYPFRVTEPVPMRALREARIGEPMAFAATIRSSRVVSNARRGWRLEAVAEDSAFARSRKVAGAVARLTFFSYKKQYVDWVAMRLHTGAHVVIAGQPTEFNGQLQFTHPEVLTVAPAPDPAFTSGANGTLRGIGGIDGSEGAVADSVGGVNGGVGDGVRVGSSRVARGVRAAGDASAAGWHTNGSGSGVGGGGVGGSSTASGGRAVGGVGTVGDRAKARPMFVPASSSLRYDADDEATALRRVTRPRPVYHATSRISSEHIHESILSFIDALVRDSGTPDSGTPDGGTSVGDITAGGGASAVSAAADNRVAGNRSDGSRSAGGATADGMPADATAFADAAACDDTISEDTISEVSISQVTASDTASSGITVADRATDHAVAASKPRTISPSNPRRIPAISDILPESVRAARGLMHRDEAFRAIHDPHSTAEFNRAIDTMRYEEAFICQTALLSARRDAHHADADPCADGALRDRFIASLPFDLTAGQRAVIDDIDADMSQSRPMQRLLQGEVGSGKTVVALAAMMQAVGSGRQAVLVAPTQVLAEQHAATIRRMVEQIDPQLPVIVLTGGMKLAARRKALAVAAAGTPCIVVATHAAFSKTFQAPNLALAVIDEQHRFGVEQRESLRTKTDRSPHLLVMTATPIPRTAAMTWFGDLDISWLTELPGGRKPIRTIVVPEADSATMGRMFAHLRRRIDAGERAYVVCPRIDADDDADDDAARADDGAAGRSRRSGASRDDGENARNDEIDVYARSDALSRELSQGRDGREPARGEGRSQYVAGAAAADAADRVSAQDVEPRPPLHAVKQIAERLAALPQFNGIEFATLTGRDDDATKARVMADFASGRTPVLVATTVIEVGVDVPQASCIVIFDADRYGLSQLHQLRGRVGRGGTDSWAFLVSRAEPGSPAEQRLSVIAGTLDGAEIAKADLEFRGAGDVLGDAQSGGRSSLKLLRVVKDEKIIADARQRAAALLDADPTLAGDVQLAGAVLDFTRGNETFLISS